MLTKGKHADAGMSAHICVIRNAGDAVIRTSPVSAHCDLRHVRPRWSPGVRLQRSRRAFDDASRAANYRQRHSSRRVFGRRRSSGSSSLHPLFTPYARSLNRAWVFRNIPLADQDGTEWVRGWLPGPSWLVARAPQATWETPQNSLIFSITNLASGATVAMPSRTAAREFAILTTRV